MRIVEEMNLLETHQKKFILPLFLCSLREAMCVSRTTMAYDLEMDYSTLFNIENGFFEKAPDLATLKKIAAYFGISADWLIEKAAHWENQGGEKCE